MAMKSVAQLLDSSLVLLLHLLSFEMNLFYEDGRVWIMDDFDNKAIALFFVVMCFQLANLIDLYNYL
ncbi:hypothetical protein A0J61_02508 [Choanephora cucurbitarum]|uniref:Uncharacterized protein n=1 Tax=Choanephora cucurbitarum TaxID=101091 RepID=A0A1C7NKB4_9FUNG|nr:hypothetical protein A0J61_02508 [Choanephora cucurbitarum]